MTQDIGIAVVWSGISEAQLVITADVLEGSSQSEVARMPVRVNPNPRAWRHTLPCGCPKPCTWPVTCCFAASR
jgi:hypothetical protein